MARTKIVPNSLSPEQWLRRRRRWRWIYFVTMVLLLVLASWADHRGWLRYAGDDWARYHNKTFVVTHVEDGDKLEIDARDGKYPHTRLRLWGVDCPLVAKPARGLGAQPMADEAAAFSKNMVLHQRVRLELQPQALRDRRGSILAYVFAEDGRMLNAELIRNGLGAMDSQNSHDRLADFHDLQQPAKENKLGIWAIPVSARKVQLPLPTTAPSSLPATTQGDSQKPD